MAHVKGLSLLPENFLKYIVPYCIKLTFMICRAFANLKAFSFEMHTGKPHF